MYIVPFKMKISNYFLGIIDFTSTVSKETSELCWTAYWDLNVDGFCVSGL